MSSPLWTSDISSFVREVKSIWSRRRRKPLIYDIISIQNRVKRLGQTEAEVETEPATNTNIVPVADETEKVKLEPTSRNDETLVVEPEIIPQEDKAPQSVETYQLITQLAQLSELSQVKEKLSKDEFKGQTDPRSFSATDKLQWIDLTEEWPHQPWYSAYFINDGPNTVEIAINRWPEKRHEIKVNETLTITQEKADKRIERLFYKCAAGGSASLRVIGQY